MKYGAKISIIVFFVLTLTTSVLAIDINSSTSMQYYSGGDLNLESTTSGDLRVPRGDLEMNGRTIKQVGELNITNTSSGTRIADFTETGVELYQPLSIQSSGSLSVANGIQMTGSSTNRIESYSTMYLSTSSGSPTDIVLDPTGVVGIGSDLDMGGNSIDMSGGNILGMGDQKIVTSEISGPGDGGLHIQEGSGGEILTIAGNEINGPGDMPLHINYDSGEDVRMADGGGDVDINGNKLRLPRVNGNPSSRSNGDIWYDTSAD